MRRLVLLSLALIATSASALGDNPKAVAVTGRAVDAMTGKPIANALIGVYQSGRGTVKTDKRGAFRVLAAPGKRIIYYDGGNTSYKSTRLTYTVANVPGKGLSGVTLNLWKTEFAQGKVFDPSGMPLAGARVTVCGSEFAHAVTDVKGRFKIAVPDEQPKPGGRGPKGCAIGAVALSVEHRTRKLGLFTETNRYKLIDGRTVLRALPARSPKIIVTDAYLKPLSGAKVYASQAYGLKSVESMVGVTNSEGELIVPAVYQGARYTFRAALPGYCPGKSAAPAVGSESWIDLIEIVTEPATSVLKGRVVDASGRPVIGAEVATDFGPCSVTNETGEFTLEQMPEWPVRLEARKGRATGANVDAKGNLIRKPETVIVLR